MSFLLRIWRWLPLPGWGRWWLTWLLVQKFLVGVMAVVLDEEGRILLLNHTYRRDHPWGLPSGWLKARESAAAAIEREVIEETGLRVQVTHPLIIGGNDDNPRVDLVFACRFVGGTFRPSAEVSEAQFFKLEALPHTVELYQRRLIARAAELLAPG